MKSKKTDFRPLMGEGPRAVGMMSVVIESGGSLDSAVRDVAAEGPDNTKKLFSGIVQDTDTRVAPDIRSGLNDLMAQLPKELATFRRSVHMLMAASEMSSGSEKTRILKDATDISLAGLKETGEAYSSSLSNPCMMIFGLGIMVPMIMMSILPILQIGGMFGASLGLAPVIVTTLVIVPACVLCVTLSINAKNPFGTEEGDRDWRCLMPLLVSVPLGIVGWNITGDVVQTMVFAAVPAGALTFALLNPSHVKEKKRAETEKLLKDSIFELGNRLISGDNFESSAIGALEARKETFDISDILRKEMTLCRGDVRSAIRSALGTISPLTADTYCEVYDASLRDVREAGRLAISMGRQMQDQETVNKGISNKLKSMFDMMTATAAIFAPMVLGLSVSMLRPLSEISEAADMTGTSAVIAIYLVELCAMMAILTAAHTGKNGVRNIVYRFSMMLPLSMTVFFACMSVAL
ncbi:MAG: hypothetical protein VB016_04835 [Methanomassiliicoccaceae archaeon]|nr:hypothetical protein [Methanomassiliicoccaceae archaeon]